VTDTAPAPEAEAETDDTRTARQKVIDHLTDTEGEQTVAEIIQGTGLIRNTAEQAIFRAVQSEQIERTAPGTYRLAPPMLALAEVASRTAWRDIAAPELAQLGYGVGSVSGGVAAYGIAHRAPTGALPASGTITNC
jgi:DNA-binding IclR family transcriptional regulator